MRIERHHVFEAPVDRCWAMFHDPASHVAKFEGMGHHGVTVLEEDRRDDRLRLRITREVDLDHVPAVAARFITARNTVVTVDEWHDHGDGTYGGTFEIDTRGLPVTISGTTQLEGDDRRSRYTISVDLSVSVPLIGARLAEFGRSIVEEQLSEEFALGDTWLAEH